MARDAALEYTDPTPSRQCCACAFPRSKAEAKRMLGLGSGFLVIGIIFILVGAFVPSYLSHVLDDGLARSSALDDASNVGYGVFEDNSKFPLQLDIFMMNITNPREMIQGEKPNVKEVGPFRYYVYRTAVDPKWDDDHTLLSWRYYTRYVFDEEASVMPDSTVMTSLNMPFWGTTSAFLAMGGGQLVDTALNAAYPEDTPDREMTMAFAQRPVSELIYGYDGDPLLASMNAMTSGFVPSAYSGIITNYTSVEDTRARVKLDTMMTGYPDIRTLHQYTHFQEQDAIMVESGFSMTYPWHGVKEYGLVEGSDGAAFPMPVKPEDSPRLFAASFYRAVSLQYMQSLTYKDLHVLAFKIPETMWLSQEEYPDNEHYYQEKYSGVLNVSACANNVPLMITRPRFAGVDAEFRDLVDAEFPEDVSTAVEDNESFFYIEPRSGMTVNVASSTQVNVGVKPLNVTYEIDTSSLSHAAVAEARRVLRAAAQKASGSSQHALATMATRGGQASIASQPSFSFDPSVARNALAAFNDPTVMRAATTVLAARAAATGTAATAAAGGASVAAAGVSEVISKTVFPDMRLAYIPLFHANQTASIGVADAHDLASILYTIETVVNNTPAVAYSLAGVMLLLAVFFLYRGGQGYKLHQNEETYFVQSDNVGANFAGSAHFDPTLNALDMDSFERAARHERRFRADSYDDINLLRGGDKGSYGADITMEASPSSMYARDPSARR